MKIKRTQDEVHQMILSLADNDFFGVKTNDLLPYADFDWLKENKVIKPEVERKDWDEFVEECKTPLESIKDYMDFAWEKAKNFRGLSAARSMDHFKIWTWLLGDDEEFDFENYKYYGKDVLVEICKKYGIDHTQYDDGVRANSEDEYYDS